MPTPQQQASILATAASVGKHANPGEAPEQAAWRLSADPEVRALLPLHIQDDYPVMQGKPGLLSPDFQGASPTGTATPYQPPPPSLRTPAAVPAPGPLTTPKPAGRTISPPPGEPTRPYGPVLGEKPPAAGGDTSGPADSTKGAIEELIGLRQSGAITGRQYANGLYDAWTLFAAGLDDTNDPLGESRKNAAEQQLLALRLFEAEKPAGGGDPFGGARLALEERRVALQEAESTRAGQWRTEDLASAAAIRAQQREDEIARERLGLRERYMQGLAGVAGGFAAPGSEYLQGMEPGGLFAKFVEGGGGTYTPTRAPSIPNADQISAALAMMGGR